MRTGGLEKSIMIRKASEFVVNHRVFFVVLLLVIALVCGVLMLQVDVNYDMTKYLPNDSSMKIGLDIMNSDFPAEEEISTIRVMFDDLTEEQKTQVLSELKALEGVDDVAYEEGSEDYNRENHTLFIVQTSYAYSSEEEQAIEQALDENFSSYHMVWKNDDPAGPEVPIWILVTAVGIIMVILLVMCKSWIEPILFLLVIGVAILINMGTNIFLGSVSNITFSIGAVLQLVLSMDYSIILINRYRQERELAPNKYEAMKNALTNAFSSVASSSLTTVVGLLMLVFMSFKIGRDLGIVLAKGVFISMVCALTMLPGVILAADKLIAKTAKKELTIPMEWAGKFSYKLRWGIGVFFVVLFVAVCILQNRAGIAYSLDIEDPVADVFPKNETLVMVYSNEDESQVDELASQLEQDEHIKSVSSYGTTLGRRYSAGEMAEELADRGESMQLDESVLRMLYYDHAGGEVSPMTAGDFLNFVSESVLGSDTFSDYIEPDRQEQMDLLQKFSDARALTQPLSAQDLASFFEMEQEEVEQLMLLYYVNHGGVSEGEMTLKAFTDFVLQEVAEDDTYGSLFEDSTLEQLNQLAVLTDPEEITKPLSAGEIAQVLGLDEQTVRQIMVFCFAQDADYEPESMTLGQFVSFLQSDVLSDPAYSSFLDSAMAEQIQTLALLTDPETLQKEQTAEQLSSLLGIDESTVDLLLTLCKGQGGEDRTMTLRQFLDFLQTLTDNPLLSGTVDDKTLGSLQQLSALIETAQAGTAMTPAQMGEIFGLDEETVSGLYMLYFMDDPQFRQQTASMTMSVTDFLTLVQSAADEQSLAQLAPVEALIKAASSGQALRAEELAEILGMDVQSVEMLFAAQSQQTGQEVPAMTLSDFVALAAAAQPDNAQIQQMKSLLDAVQSGAELDSATLAALFGMEPEQVQQLFAMAAAEQETVTLPEFSAYLSDTLLQDKRYDGMLSEEQKSQMQQMNQLVQLAVSQEGLSPAALAEMFGMDEAQVSLIFRLYAGSQEEGGVTLAELVTFLVEDPAAAGMMDEQTRENLKQMQTLMQASLSGTGFTCEELSRLLGLEPDAGKMLFVLHDASTRGESWQMDLMTIAQALTAEDSPISSATDEEQRGQLQTLYAVMEGAANGKEYSPAELAALMGLEEDQVRPLYLLYTSRHGDTADWKLSPQGFLNFLVEDVLNQDDYRDLIDSETGEMLSTARDLAEAVTGGESYTPAQMSELLSPLSEKLNENTMSLLYLYAASSQAPEAEKISLEEFLAYLTDKVLADPRFEDLIDEDMRSQLTQAQDQLTEGKDQLVSEQFSRMVLTMSYPQESPETTAFMDNLTAQCEQNLTGEYHLVGNIAMNYEMEHLFDRELTMITLLTGIAIFLIVAVTFRSLFVPLLLVLVVQTGVYSTVCVIAFLGGSMYYLALLIVECILMGATIDYGILFTSYYREKRQSMGIQMALQQAYAGSAHTILTSGLILVLVTAIIFNFFEEPTVSTIVKTISIGALFAILLILFVLPGLLALCDRFVVGKKRSR